MLKFILKRSTLLLLSSLLVSKSFPQSIGTFNSIIPTAQTQSLVLPTTHTFQRIIKTGDVLSLGGFLGTKLDFTGYVPIDNSTHGFLSISSESAPAECAVLNISLNAGTRLWNVNSGGKVAFPFADLGAVSNFCSGTVTPRKTIIIGEEATPAGDGNGDGYQDVGWTIEIDPATRKVINQDNTGGVDKLWAVGRQAHENVVVNAGETVMYWGADATATGFIYKFIPAVPGKYSAGSLFVLKTTSSLGTGTWQPVPNVTQGERNNTVPASTAAGAFNFNGIEDVEIGLDGKIYFAAKSSGRIYRFRDLGTSVDQLQVFVESVNYDVDGTGPIPVEPWGLGNDNLAFDNEGNLWVLQDGGRNHIWVVAPTHTASSPKVRLFATTPAGSEPTGITFSPDNKFLFLSFQHPFTTNTASQKDVSGNNVIFNTATTVVIARKENLGIWPGLSINNPSVTEGNIGTKNVFFDVALDRKSSVPVSVKFRMLHNNTNAADLTVKSGTLTFPANTQLLKIDISIKGDIIDEFNETFRLILYDPVNAILGASAGTCTIVDDDLPPAIRVTDTSTTESKMLATIRLNLTAPSGKVVNVKYDTRNISAVTPADYTGQLNGTTTFNPGQTIRYINVAVRNDNVNEPTETFQLVLKQPVNATLAYASGARPIGTISIINSNVTLASVAQTNLVIEDGLNIHATPNPSFNEFFLYIKSTSNKRGTLHVRDVLGRVVEMRTGILANSTQRIGADWKQGIYIAEYVQGNSKRTIRIVKFN